jgi:transposase
MSTDAAKLTSEQPSLADAPALSNDPAILQQMIRALLATLHEKDRRLEQVTHRLDQLLRRLFGPRAEKINPDQLLLFAAAAEPVVKSADTEASTLPPEPASRAKKKGHGRRALPQNLPRLRQVHDLPEAERLCPGCGQERELIGIETSEQLEYVPASLHVIVHERPKYACKHCQEHVALAEKPAQPIDKGLPGPGLLAHVITCKYADHLPLYRLERIFERQGVELSRSTLCDWMAASAALLRPLYERMVDLVRQSRVLHTDDTPVPVLDGARDTTRQGRMWVYVGDRDHPHTVFAYTPNHSRDGPAQFLDGYQGYLQADAFKGYDGIYTGSAGRIVEVACWAHARRKFYDARTTDPARAHLALAWIRRLYDVEDQAKDCSDADRAAYRQAHSRPLLTAFGQWLQEQQAGTLPKSPIGQANAYALSNWDALGRYLEAGFLAIDNNAAERALRAIAIGRKNWLFCGSDRGGATAAILFSFIATCHRHDLDPFTYLRDVLTRLPSLLQDRLDELLPDRWTAPPPVAGPSH